MLDHYAAGATAPAASRVTRQPPPVDDEPGLVMVDATWGTIQPIALPGVETVGELEIDRAPASRRAD